MLSEKCQKTLCAEEIASAVVSNIKHSHETQLAQQCLTTVCVLAQRSNYFKSFKLCGANENLEKMKKLLRKAGLIAVLQEMRNQRVPEHVVQMASQVIVILEK